MTLDHKQALLAVLSLLFLGSLVGVFVVERGLATAREEEASAAAEALCEVPEDEVDLGDIDLGDIDFGDDFGDMEGDF